MFLIFNKEFNDFTRNMILFYIFYYVIIPVKIYNNLVKVFYLLFN